MNRIWNLEQYRDRTALIDEYGNSFSYEFIAKETRALAEKVVDRRLIFCLCRNEIGSILGYVGFINNGMVPLLLNSHLENGLLDKLLSVYEPAYLWIPKDQVDQFDMKCIYEMYDYCLMETGYEKKYPLYEELALLLTTSGSTGSPKFVRQSYLNILDNTKSIIKYLKIDETESAITTLPMNYTYGLSIINTHLFAGATILVTDKSFMQKEFWTFFKDAGATSFGGVPYTYEMLDKLRFCRMKLPALRTMTQAGGKLAPELHEKFARYAEESEKKFVIMYGQCEATARMGYLPPEEAVRKKGSMGIPIPGGKFILTDENGHEIRKPHTTGELIYEGTNVTLGYAECGADLAKGDERHGVLETGDMAQFDEEGYFYIVGRKKRFLKIYGNRVNLDEVERMIKGEYGIEAASAGVDDHMYLFVTDPSITDKIREFVIGKTRLNTAAFKIVTVSEIPKNEAGKTLYKELEKYYDKKYQ